MCSYKELIDLVARNGDINLHPFNDGANYLKWIGQAKGDLDIFQSTGDSKDFIFTRKYLLYLAYIKLLRSAYLLDAYNIEDGCSDFKFYGIHEIKYHFNLRCFKYYGSLAFFKTALICIENESKKMGFNMKKSVMLSLKDRGNIN